MTTPHTPTRVQLKRTKGWKMPPQCVKVARPTVFGNPFTVAGAKEVGFGEYRWDGTRATPEEQHRSLADWCVSLFREWLMTNKDNHDPKRRAELLARLPVLRGKSLACFCKLSDPCHADLLLELANKESDQ